MPTSYTPDDTPAWIKGDLPVDLPETGAEPVPDDNKDMDPSVDTGGIQPELLDDDGSVVAAPVESAAETGDLSPDLDEETATDPEEQPDQANDLDDLLPDPQESAEADPYDLPDPYAEAPAPPEDDSEDRSEAIESRDWAEIDDAMAIVETESIVEIVTTGEPDGPESQGGAGEPEHAPEPPTRVVLETFVPAEEGRESPPVRLDESQPAAGARTELVPPPEPPAIDHLSLESLIESLLFVADGAVPIARLAEALEVPNRDIEAALTALGVNYRLRGLSLQRFRDKVQLTTSPSAAAQVERFLGLAAATPLSRAALEALAIVAYQQPVTRPQIEAVRGVNSDSVIKNLLTKGLIEESGRAEGPGRPVLYSTTTEFMQHFGLTSLSDLPPLSPLSPDNAVNAERILKG